MNVMLSFNNLPEWLQKPIRQIRPHDYDTWIHQPVPALHGRSVVDVFQMSETGEQELREYIAKVTGKFFS